MLSELYGRLAQWLTAEGFTVYAEDAVPPEAAFPFLTLRIEPALSPCEAGCVTLTSWHRSSASHADRLVAADALCALVPRGGLRLVLQSGLALLFPLEAPASWQKSQEALGVSLRFRLLCCPCP